MTNDNKSSIIKEALTDYKAIKEAADTNAMKKLAEEFPEKFNTLLKEELQNKNKAKESYKKLDEAKESEESDETILNKEESVMKKDEKETKKVEETAGKGKPFEKAAPKVAKVQEDVKITDTVGDGDPFTEKAKGVKKVDENVGNNKPFDQKTKKIQNETFDLTELDLQSAGMAIESAGEEDQIFADDTSDEDLINMEDIEKEISEMEGLGEELKGIESNSPSYMENGNKGIAFDQLVGLKNQLDEILSGMQEMHQGNAVNQVTSPEAYTDKLIDEEEISTQDVENVIGGGNEVPVEETVANNHSNQKHVTATIPSRDYKPESAVAKMRYGLQESEIKFGGLISENKILTKKLNETKKFKQSVTTLVEQYKSALEKYRNQLKEMATFNTNLAHVNNLLVNESLALTQEDKIKIINEFKKVDSIAESQKKYNMLLTEMKGSKKTLTESIEKKVSASIQPSSKQKLDEVVEKTAYENNEHINKMKRLIEYADKTRSKKII